jgi:hypothetical protein
VSTLTESTDLRLAVRLEYAHDCHQQHIGIEADGGDKLDGVARRDWLKPASSTDPRLTDARLPGPTDVERADDPHSKQRKPEEQECELELEDVNDATYFKSLFGFTPANPSLTARSDRCCHTQQVRKASSALHRQVMKAMNTSLQIIILSHGIGNDGSPTMNVTVQ